MKVVLQVYDLSQGIAKAMAPMLMGQDIEAVYHTGVAVGETEYYYSAGIQSDVAGQTHFGTPMKQIDMGETEKTAAEVSTFLDSIRPRYTEASYNLIEHNCNHFSNEFLKFLCNASVPDNIINQGVEFLATPIGRMVAPMLQSNILGIPGATPRVPRPSLSPNGQETKTAIAIERPIVFTAKEADLRAAQDKILVKYGGMGMLEEGSAFHAAFSGLVHAVLNKTPYTMDPAIVRSLCGLLADEISAPSEANAPTIAALLDCLACVCLTTDQKAITDACLPLRLIECHDALPTDALEALYRYIHNWLVQLRGMHDFRDNSLQYLGFITTKLMESEQPLRRLYGHRLLFTASRVFTKQMAADNYGLLCRRLVDLLLAAAEKAKLDDPARKSHVQVANLTSGALGRLILTADDRDAAEGWYATAQKALRDGGLLSLGAPCCTDLYEHLSADSDKTDLY